MCSLRFFLVWGACFAVLVSELPAGEGVRPKDEQVEGFAPGKAGGKKGAAKKRRSSWVPVDEGLGRVRKKYLPAIILFEESQSPLGEGGGGNPVSPSASFLRSHLSKGRLRSVLKKFVLIRVSREDLKRVYPVASKEPPGALRPLTTIGEELGIQGDHPEIVVLNYWEDDVLRYVGKLPRLAVLKKKLKLVWKVNKVYAHRGRRVAAELEKSRYAFKLKNRREAVLKVRLFESEKEQELMDPVLKKRVNVAIREYRDLAETAIRKAGKLENKKKFLAALEIYDDVMKDFPFQDIVVFCSKKKNEIHRKLTLGAVGRGPR